LSLIFYNGFNRKALAQEQSMICPLKKMVPVGSLDDQTIFSVNGILTQIQNVLDYSTYASLSATQLIKFSNSDCKPENCTSDCTPDIEYDTCTPVFPPAYPPSGTCPNGTTCYPGEPDQCPREVCDENKCQNAKTLGQEGCYFGSIDNAILSISANRNAVEIAAAIIDDFFSKNVSEFTEPAGFVQIFGKFCQHPFLSQFCSSCSTTCTTAEFNALAFLESKAIDNINLCDIIKPEDIIAGKQGELLFTCKDVMPAPVLRCYLNDFFCCSAEEPK
jgi:hypothetical protein